VASCYRSGQLVGTLSGEMTIHATLETRAQTLTSLVLCILCRLRCGARYWLRVLSQLLLHTLSVHLLWCTAIEHLVSTSGTMVVASKIGGAAFASVSAFSSSAVA
jgi:hypothetical protein